MNEKDMSIQRTDLGFTVDYRSNIISRADVNPYAGTILFYFFDGDTATVDVSVYVGMSKAYNSQFGITLTDDGTRFFVQSWETGLFCFETETGNLLWHNKQKKAYHLATVGTTLLCHYKGKCISIINVETGLPIRSYPLALGATFKPLCRDYYLVGPKRGYYEILDSNLERRAKIAKEKLNPYAMDNFIIQNASLTEGGITIEGVEYMSELLTKAIKAGKADEFDEQIRFVRQIPVRLPGKSEFT